jgi:hypothetical protein
MLLFHVLRDGFTVLGKVYKRGEEIRISKTSVDYANTFDRNGNTFFDLTEQDQLVKWGEVRFKPGSKWTTFSRRHTEEEYQRLLDGAQSEEERSQIVKARDLELAEPAIAGEG